MVGIRIEGDKKVNATLASAVSQLDQPQELFATIGANLVASTKGRFDVGNDPQGNPWPPSIRALVSGGRTLIDRGQLRASITHQPTQGGVAVGSNVIYAAIHQFGGTIKAKTKKGLSFRPAGANRSVIVKSVQMPTRAFLGLDDDDRSDIHELAEEFMASALGEGGSNAS